MDDFFPFIYKQEKNKKEEKYLYLELDNIYINNNIKKEEKEEEKVIIIEIL